jgi:hypothetical protein
MTTMHCLAELQTGHGAGLARAYVGGSCPMPSTAAWTVAPIFRVHNATKRRPRLLILSQ